MSEDERKWHWWVIAPGARAVNFSTKAKAKNAAKSLRGSDVKYSKTMPKVGGRHTSSQPSIWKKLFG